MNEVDLYYFVDLSANRKCGYFCKIVFVHYNEIFSVIIVVMFWVCLIGAIGKQKKAKGEYVLFVACHASC